MKAYVINQDQLKQYIVIGIAALVLSFLFGYVIGGSVNESAKVASGKTIDSMATERSVLLEKQAEAQEADRSEEHTSELQSRGLNSYAVVCLKKKKNQKKKQKKKTKTKTKQKTKKRQHT